MNPKGSTEGGETARRQCFFVASFAFKFPTLSRDAIPNATVVGHAGRATYRYAGNLYASPFCGQDGNSMPHSPAGFKWGF